MITYIDYFELGVLIPTVEDYCLGIVLGVVKNAVNISKEMEMMF